MLPPQNPKEVKQFLGLIGIIENLYPNFQIWPRALNALTQKNTAFEWTQICPGIFKFTEN